MRFIARANQVSIALPVYLTNPGASFERRPARALFHALNPLRWEKRIVSIANAVTEMMQKQEWVNDREQLKG